MNRKELELQLAEMHPEDGFRIRKLQNSHGCQFHLMYYSSGSPVFLPASTTAMSEILKEWSGSLEAATRGNIYRDQLLLTSLCRYINTGGKVADLQELATRFCAAIPLAEAITLGDYFLVESHINTDGVYEHLFMKENCADAIRWVEDAFFDVVSMGQLRREQQEEEATTDGRDSSTGDDSAY